MVLKGILASEMRVHSLESGERNEGETEKKNTEGWNDSTPGVKAKGEESA